MLHDDQYIYFFLLKETLRKGWSSELMIVWLSVQIKRCDLSVRTVIVVVIIISSICPDLFVNAFSWLFQQISN